MTIIAAADGSALGNPGPAGWAWYVDDSCWRAGGWPHGTNNMGELMAVLDLFLSTAHLPEEPLHILCDSQYVINSVTKWMPGWKRKGWRKADGKAVLNVELLKQIDVAIVGRKYHFEWVKGHAGHDLNEAADDRARDAATAYQAKELPNAGPGFPGAQLVTATVTTGSTSLPGSLLEAPVSQPTAQASQSAAQDSQSAVQAFQSAVQASPQMALDSRRTAQVSQTTILETVAQLDLFSILEDEADPAFASPGDPLLEQLPVLERELLDPAVRADPIRVGELLHPSFEEIGVSGQCWSRMEVLTMLSQEEASETGMELLTLDRLNETTALLTYRSTSARGSALRSSLWLFEDDRWQLRFHQGTLTTLEP